MALSKQDFFRKTLLKWSQNTPRVMPWSDEKDPYLIWLSEIILQQTRVEQGWHYYIKFKNAYPNVYELAEAPLDDILTLWQGLGYYSRARNLHHTAKTIVEEYNGLFPNNYKQLLSLKGIGPYTAAAIGSFAFQLPEAVVDGNVQRVLARFWGISTPIDSTQGKKIFHEKANLLLDKNQ